VAYRLQLVGRHLPRVATDTSFAPIDDAHFGTNARLLCCMCHSVLIPPRMALELGGRGNAPLSLESPQHFLFMPARQPRALLVMAHVQSRLFVRGYLGVSVLVPMVRFCGLAIVPLAQLGFFFGVPAPQLAERRFVARLVVVAGTLRATMAVGTAPAIFGQGRFAGHL
jgi:hypothetical protein